MQFLYKQSYSRTKLKGLMGFDFGIAQPSCFLLGFLTPLGVPVILDGFYQPGGDVLSYGHQMESLMAKYWPFIDFDYPIWSDPAIFKRNVVNKQGKGATTVHSLFQSNFGFYMKPGQNDIMNGIAKLTTYLTVDEMPNEIMGGKGPCIYFSDHMHYVSDEFGSYFFATDSQNERIDTPIDRNDHVMDTLKYMLSDLPHAHELLYVPPAEMSAYGAHHG